MRNLEKFHQWQICDKVNCMLISVNRAEKFIDWIL